MLESFLRFYEREAEGAHKTRSRDPGFQYSRFNPQQDCKRNCTRGSLHPGHGTKKKVGRVSSDRSALDPSANRAGWSAVMPGMRFTGCSNNGDKHFFGAVPHSWVARVNAGAIPTP